VIVIVLFLQTFLATLKAADSNAKVVCYYDSSYFSKEGK
jgi:hypothetical protein